MTQVEFFIVLPTGEALPNARVEIQLSKASFTDGVDGIAMPRPVIVTTDETGKVVLPLWPSTAMYYATVTDPGAEAEIFYKFLVPEVPTGTVVRLQDLVISGPISETTYDEAAIAAIHAAKAETLASASSAIAAVTQVNSLIASFSGAVQPAIDAAAEAALSEFNAQAAAADALASKNAAQTAATSAVASEASATTSKNQAAASAATATTKAGEATTSATAAAASATAATTAATSVSGVDTAVLANKVAAEAAASDALTSKNAAATSAAAAAQSAAEAFSIAGGQFVTAFNTRYGAVTLTLADVTAALGFTPYNNTNPANYVTSAGNVATATKLATARAINGVAFDGSGDITITDATKLPLAGGTLTGNLTAPGLFVGVNAVWHAGNLTPSALAFPGVAQEISANTAAVVNTLYHLNSAAGGFDLTFPANPAEGSWIWVVDAKGACGTNSVFLRGNGKKFGEVLDDIQMDFSGDSIFLYFKGNRWVEQ